MKKIVLVLVLALVLMTAPVSAISVIHQTFISFFNDNSINS